MNKLALLSAAGVMALAIPTSANAVTIMSTVIFEPADITSPFTPVPLGSTVSLGQGDTLDLTITFTGGASVSLENDTFIWPLLFSSESATLQTSGTFEFLGASSNVVSGPIAISQQMALFHIGNRLTSGSYRLDTNPISFSGIRQIITIDSDDLGAVRDYDRIAFATDGIVGLAGGIPEPTTWALMIAGFGMIGGAMRRRRKTNISVSYA